jgi:hypothetical protein
VHLQALVDLQNITLVQIHGVSPDYGKDTPAYASRILWTWFMCFGVSVQRIAQWLLWTSSDVEATKDNEADDIPLPPIITHLQIY